MANLKEVRLPDLGNVKNAEIIEVLVKVGDEVKVDEPLLTLESEKASMDIPSPLEGKIKELKVKIGDKVNSGDIILTLELAEEAAKESDKKTESAKSKPADSSQSEPEAKISETQVKPQTAAQKPAEPAKESSKEPASTVVHAGPGVRRLAHELNIDLSQVKASGAKERILKEDLIAFMKNQSPGTGLPSAPAVDFEQFGPTESVPLSRIKRLTATHLHRNWLLVPHVTQFAETDITDLEEFRKAQQVPLEKKGIKLTVLAFIMKAVVSSLKAFPQFNASLSPQNDQLILKKYFHIGVAVDTPEGLVVPVIREVDQKGIFELAEELSVLSKKARDKKLKSSDMQGGCFSISSLGGIGGTAFTPIVNLPEVAILGVSRSAIKPVYRDKQFQPRLMLPLSLSYDHRVIDGAEGARFIMHLAAGLNDMRLWSL